MSKIFGIGLPRTGTTSLHAAAELLGLRSVHFAADSTTVAQVRSGDYRLKVVEQNDLVCDVPIPAIFPQLDEAFPNSKFIYTYRDVDSWIESHKKVRFNKNIPAVGSVRDFYRTLLYGVVSFSDQRFRWVHFDHHRRVLEYFSGARSEDLLIVDIAAGEGWEKLCPFLGFPIPDKSFPKRNVSGMSGKCSTTPTKGLQDTLK